MSDSPEALLIRDEIHGDMTFDPLVRKVIDHEYFQRLRYIRQLGLAEYVFPCANHSRFQHSLGASHLGSLYFRSLMKAWLVGPADFVSPKGGTEVLGQATFECVHGVAAHGPSLEFWGQVVALAALLHDIGHGPWSHTFEVLDLAQDFSSESRDLTGLLGAYFRPLKNLHHEDLSVLYIRRILADLERRGLLSDTDRFLLPVASLVNRKLGMGPLARPWREELESGLSRRGLVGGASFHRLLSPLISGPFDVDRMDYIQRDGRNCGVSIGGIEWRRILGRVVPYLARHPNDKGEPEDVVLVSSIKNQHPLDDFIFSLFQMYAQVYLHPKIVGLEERIRLTIVKQREGKPPFPVDFARHSSLTDDSFRHFLEVEMGVPEVGAILLRQQGAKFTVTTYPSDVGWEKELRDAGFSLIETLDRPMMKDSVGVFLYSAGATGRGSKPILAPWTKVSPLAAQYYNINYSPKIWIRPEG